MWPFEGVGPGKVPDDLDKNYIFYVALSHSAQVTINLIIDWIIDNAGSKWAEARVEGDQQQRAGDELHHRPSHLLQV